MANIPFRKVLGLNQQTYQRLKMSLSLNLRRQIFVAVCDDLVLRDRLAAQLQNDISRSAAEQTDAVGQVMRVNGRSAGHNYPQFVSLQLNLDDPNPLIQIAQWLTQFPPPIVRGQRAPMPAFQILGVEHLTRQSPAIQRLFFTHLQTIERNLPLLDFSLLIWTTEPWFYALPQSAPGFWRCRTGVFEFIGDPTPLSITAPERFGAQSSQQGATTSLLRERELVPLRKEPPRQPPAQVEVKESVTQLVPAPEQKEEDSTNPIAPATADELENPWSILAEDLFQPYEPAEEAAAAHEPLLAPEAPAAAPDELDELDELEAEAPLPQAETPQAETTQARATAKQEAEQKTEQKTEQPVLPLAAEASSTAAAETSVTPELLGEVPVEPIQVPDEILAIYEPVAILYRHIQELHRQQAHPTQFVDAYCQLGNFFRDRIEMGEVTPHNLTIAIQAYEQVLLWLTESSPLWVDILNDLGNLYWMTSRATTNATQALLFLQQGVRAYQLALTKINPEAEAQTYPMVQNNLGAAYADLARYHDSVQNLELSIQSYQQALRYRQPETDPLRYASTQNNLGTTYWNLAQYKDPPTNLKLSAHAYSEALHYYDPEQEPLNYAMIQNNLGTAYWNLSQHERPQEWLTLAVSAYQMALKYRTLEAAPVAHAATQNNLGTAFWHVANHSEDAQERSNYLKQAIAAYEAALEAADYLKQHQPGVAALNFDPVATRNNLGLAHYQLATDVMNQLAPAAQTQHLQAALDHHVMALQGWENQSNLRQTALNCLIQTARAAYSQLGLPGQTMALSRIPGHLLPEILPKL
ncbi:MAG: hypothetical protein Kow00121_67990 [Elainellaceae cyanobacterium]